MLWCFKWAFALAVMAVVVCASLDQNCGRVLCEKTLEGLLAGLLVGLVLAVSKLETLWPRRALTIRRAICLIRRDVCAGLVGGLLLGFCFALVILLSN